MAATIQLRGDTATNWTAANPVLRHRELAIETDTGQFKIGDGVTAWNSLGYIQIGSAANSLRMNDGVSPSAPLSGVLLYGANRGGRRMPAFMGLDGMEITVQPDDMAQNVVTIEPGSGTAFTVRGGPTFTAVGTVSHPALTATLVRKEGRTRAIVTSAATANSASELRIAANMCYRGDAAGFGGFHMRWKWGMNTAVSLQRTAVGLWGNTGATATTQSPSALTNCIFMGNDSGDTNMQIMHNDASGTCTKINLGASFPANSTTAIYDLDLFAAPNAASVGYRVRNLVSGAVSEGTLSTDLPPTTTFLVPHAYANNGGTAAAVILDFYKHVLATPY